MFDGYGGVRATVMGLGTRAGGAGVARYLAEQGAVVTVTDLRSADELAASVSDLADVPIRYVLGQHDERDFTRAGADLVVRNPGVRRASPLLRIARASGVRIEMEMSLFFRACPAPIVGITGTKGKTTTSALCGAMLSAWKTQTVVAGNMGRSALSRLNEITRDTPVVLELSSWQLEALDEHQLAPRIAVLTNVSEDHLDTYDGYADYAATKRTITAHQRSGDRFIVNADDPEGRRAIGETHAQIVPFGLGESRGEGVWVSGSGLTLVEDGIEAVFPWPESWMRVAPGDHMLLNAAAAAAAARAAGAPFSAIETGLAAFTGVADRDEWIDTIDGITFVNDTAATAPAATVAALGRYQDRRVHWLCGGSDKKLDLAPLADLAPSVASIVLLDGSATTRLVRLFEERGVAFIGPVASMTAAVEAALHDARTGDIVLLSPGCASFGLFRDEFDRGEQFRQAVSQLARPRVAR